MDSDNPPPAKQAVLMVCLGNICRSPMAQGALESAARAAGLALVVDSAGTGGWHVGEAPDPRAVAAAARRGHRIAGQRARQVARADFGRFDLILAMDADNLAALERMRPEGARARLALLLDHSDAFAGAEVPDPYYGDDDAFDAALEMIESGVAGVARALAEGR